MTYIEFIPDLINIIEFYLKTSLGPDTSINKDSLYNHLIYKCNKMNFDIHERVNSIKIFSYSDISIFGRTYNIDDYICFTNTHKYDMINVNEYIGEFLKWKISWLSDYINQYPDDKYYTNIYNDTYNPIIQIVIIPFEQYICLTPYELWFYIK